LGYELETDPAFVCTVQVLEKAECEAMGMGSYLGVAQGAKEPPKFIHMTLSPPGGKARCRGQGLLLLDLF
jgi:leucyl aminopeptidase